MTSTRARREIPHQEKVLAAIWSLRREVKVGYGAKLEDVYNLVRQRHSNESPKLDDKTLKVAKTALVSRKAVTHSGGPTARILEEAIQGVQSWKLKNEDEAADTEQAALRYLEQGTKPGFVRAPSSERTTRFNKGKEKATEPDDDDEGEYDEEDDENEEDDEEEERSLAGRKRSAQNEAGQGSKRVKVVAVSTTFVEQGDAETQALEERDKNQKQSPGVVQQVRVDEGRGTKRNAGSAGPGVEVLTKAELVEKVRELERRLKSGEKREDPQPEQELGKRAAKVQGAVHPRALGAAVPQQKDVSKEAEAVEDSEDLTDIEDTQNAEQAELHILDPHLPNLPNLPSQPLPPASASYSVSVHQRRGSPLVDPPIHHSAAQTVSFTSRRLSGENRPRQPASVVPLSAPPASQGFHIYPEPGRPQREHLQEKPERQSAFEHGSRTRYTSSPTETRRRAESDERDDNDLQEGDQTLVENDLEGVEKSIPTMMQPPPGYLSRRSRRTLAKPRTPTPTRRFEVPWETSPAVDALMLKRLAEAQEEIASLMSLRDELARERNDATAEKAQLRRSLESSQQEVEQMNKASRASHERREAVEKENREMLEDLENKLEADQSAIAAMTQDVTDLEAEKAKLNRDLQSRLHEVESLIAEKAELQSALDIAQAELDHARIANSHLERQSNDTRLVVSQLEGELKVAKEDFLQLEEERMNEVQQLSEENRTKIAELQNLQNSYRNLQLDVCNLGVSCEVSMDDKSTSNSIIKDAIARFVTVNQHLAHRESSTSQAMGVARNLFEVLSSSLSRPRQFAVPPKNSTLEDLLTVLTVRISEFIHQMREVSRIASDNGLLEAISDLAVAGGGTEVPTSFAQLPKAIADIKRALIDKNTAILQLETRLQTTQVDLDEANLSHRTLESSLDQIQGELGATVRRLGEEL